MNVITLKTDTSNKNFILYLGGGGYAEFQRKINEKLQYIS